MDDSFRKKLDEQIANFNRMMLVCNANFKESFAEKSYRLDYVEAGFICLGVTDQEYYYQYLSQIQHDLDCCIRRFLLSGVLLKTLFGEYDKTQFEDDCAVFFPEYAKTTREFEQQMGLEFILKTDNKNIGFRYSDIVSDASVIALLDCIKAHKVDEIMVVDMHYTDHVPYHIPSEGEKKLGIPVRRCCLQDLFLQYSNKNFYDVFIESVKKAIEEYKDFTGITTIPKMTAYALFKFRFVSENNFINYLTMSMQCRSQKQSFCMPHGFTYGYHFLDQSVSKRKYYVDLDKRTQQLLNETSILARVKNNKTYRALVGRSNFARCFLTSEYLYRHYNKKDQFDYVAIVSGYLKSVEQLMFAIADSYSSSKGAYKKYVKKDKKLVTITSPLIEDPDTTMGGLCFFYQNNKDIIAKLSQQQKETFFFCLFCYKDECRNDSFHKHNISDWDRVEYIRSNTFLVYALLLGCCELGNDCDKDLQIATDDRISRIVYQMEDWQHYNLYWRGKEIIPVHGPEYQYYEVDGYGILKGKTLTLDIYHGGLKRSEHIVLLENDLPDAIWYVDITGKRIYLSY